MCYPVWYENRGGCYLFGTKLPFLGLPVWYWKTPLNHRYLWINLTVVVVQNAVRSPRNDFQRCGDLRGRPLLAGSSEVIL